MYGRTSVTGHDYRTSLKGCHLQRNSSIPTVGGVLWTPPRIRASRASIRNILQRACFRSACSDQRVSALDSRITQFNIYCMSLSMPDSASFGVTSVGSELRKLSTNCWSRITFSWLANLGCPWSCGSGPKYCNWPADSIAKNLNMFSALSLYSRTGSIQLWNNPDNMIVER